MTDLKRTKLRNHEDKSLGPADLTERLPFEDNFFDSISIFDALDHIPCYVCDSSRNIAYPLFNLMSDIAQR